MKLFAEWIIKKQDVSKAIQETNDMVAISWGETEDDQKEGFDFSEGLTDIIESSGDFVKMRYVTKQDVVAYAWMSPYCFENIQTFDPTGEELGGEAVSFGRV